MPRSAAKTRRRIIDAAYALFYRQGFARVSVDAIAAQAGVTKRTLYAHFGSKDALLAAVLDLQHGLALERIGAWSKRLSGNVDALLTALFADLARWATRPRWSGALAREGRTPPHYSPRRSLIPVWSPGASPLPVNRSNLVGASAALL
jgi:AcrR family transcriptional regulator